MSNRDVDFAAVLDAVLGRSPLTGGVPDGVDASVRARALRLIAAGRAAIEQPAPSRKTLRRAESIFRAALRDAKPGLLRLVFDSWLQPAPALRYEGADRPRFLRYDGPCTVELQISSLGGRVELRGQIDPADAASEARLQIGKRVRRAAISAAGTFAFEGLAHGTASLQIGETRVEAVPL